MKHLWRTAISLLQRGRARMTSKLPRKIDGKPYPLRIVYKKWNDAEWYFFHCPLTWMWPHFVYRWPAAAVPFCSLYSAPPAATSSQAHVPRWMAFLIQSFHSDKWDASQRRRFFYSFTLLYPGETRLISCLSKRKAKLK